MRRVLVGVFCVVMVQLAMPAPADAWWEWLEELSGPGWFKGFDIDGRLVCFMDTSGRESIVDAVSKTEAAVAATKAALGTNRNSVSVVAYDAAWKDPLDKWKAAAEAWTNAAGRQAYRADAAMAVALQIDPATRPEAVAEAYARAVRSLKEIVEGGEVNAFSAGGLLYSACEREDAKDRRRGSINLGMRFMWTHDDEFASGHRIMLTTFEPSFSWRLSSRKYWDFVDYGVGAGIYWFSSDQFPSHKGGFLEPIRLDFHAPSDVKSEWAKVPVLRMAYLVFPGGFEPTAFAPTSPRAPQRIDRDWVFNIGIFADLEPLLRIVNKK